jgi:hypothetical protein
MRFSMPHLPGTFELPDDWLAEAGFTGFVPTGSAYRSSKVMLLAPLTVVEPIVRFVSVPKDFGGFDRVRLVRVLKGFVAGDDIEPVRAMELPTFEFCTAPYRYRVCDGFHVSSDQGGGAFGSGRRAPRHDFDGLRRVEQRARRRRLPAPHPS